MPRPSPQNPRRQFRIAGALGLILVAALGLAALKVASDEWAGGMVSLTLFLLIASWLGVLFARGPARAFWTGFALLGWSHLLLISVPVLEQTVGRYMLAPRVAPLLDQWIHAQPPPPPGQLGAPAVTGGFQSVFLMGGMGYVSVLDGQTPFGQIVIALETLLWAFVGGLFARRAVTTRPVPQPTPLFPPLPEPAPPTPAAVAPLAPAPPPHHPTPPVRLGTVSELPPSSA